MLCLPCWKWGLRMTEIRNSVFKMVDFRGGLGSIEKCAGLEIFDCVYPRAAVGKYIFANKIRHHVTKPIRKTQ